MNTFLLTAVLLAAVQGAWAIKCYKCSPDFSSLSSDNKKDCINPTDTLDCSNSSFAENITADSCFTLSVTLAYPSVAHDISVYFEDCGIKSRCTEFKNKVCRDLEAKANATGTQIKGCNIACCESDLCNNPPDQPVTTGPTTRSSGISIFPNGAIFGILGLLTVAFMNLF